MSELILGLAILTCLLTLRLWRRFRPKALHIHTAGFVPENAHVQELVHRAHQSAQEDFAKKPPTRQQRPEGEHAVHVPSPFYNRGPNDGGSYYNYGRLEADALHHVSAAVHAFGSASGGVELCRQNIRAVRRLMDVLEEMLKAFPADYDDRPIIEPDSPEDTAP